MLQIRRIRRALAGLATCSVALVAAACGGSDGAGDSAAASGDGADLDMAEQVLAEYREGQFESPPTEAPKPQPGKNVWIVTYGLASTPGADFDRGAKEAAQVMGWDTTSCDGKFSPDQWQNCYRQAIAAGADALAVYVNDCASTQAALREVQEAEIPVVSAEAADCDDQKEGAEPLFDAQVEFAQGSFREWLAALLEPVAAYVVTEKGADARIILVDETGNYAVSIMREAFKGYLGEMCSACEIVDTVEYTGTELGSPLQAKIGQALIKNPDANVIVTPYDDAAQTGAVPAVRESGRRGDILVTAGPGNGPTLDLIRSGDIAGGYAQDLAWEGWAVMDALNRILNGEEPKPSGQGIGWVDGDNVPSGSYESPIDYKSIYTKALTGGAE